MGGRKRNVDKFIEKENSNFTKTRVKERKSYCFGDRLIPEASSFIYLGIIMRSELNWEDHVIYTLREGTSVHNAYTQKGKEIIRNV